MNALDYILKANLYGLLFVGCYWLLLRRHTFFTLNRAYLLASVILSLILPLASLPAQTVETLPVPLGIIALPVTAIGATPIETGPDWTQIALLAYGFIALVLLLRLAIRIGRLFRFIQQLLRQVCDDYVLVLAPEADGSEAATPTFSFFRYLVLNPADAQNELIIRHELVHIRQRHSVDVLVLALLRAVFWISPSLWLIDRMLRQVHEFLADKQASQPTIYARFLVEYAFGTKTDTLTNGFFNPSLLTQRILMLHQQATNRWALGKYALVLPLAFGLLAMTTAREEIAAVVSQVTEETIAVSGQVTGLGKPLAGSIVMISSTGKGTPTDSKGNFKLPHVPKKALLSVSFVGFTSTVVPVNGRTTINISLAPANPNELPKMGATAVYKAIKPNPDMPVRTPPSSETINGKVYTAVEEPAVFPTGIPGLMQYVAHSLRYPAKAKAAKIEGTAFVQFIVMSDGSIGAATIKRGFDFECNEEALRVVRQMPKWLPGKQNGKTVATQFVLPIQFALEKKEDKRTGQVKVSSQSDSSQKIAFIIDNSKNAPYALYNDVNPRAYPLLDSLPKSGTIIKIRDRRPLSELGPEPLYIIDSVEISKNTPRPLDKIKPNNIQSINVLKGVSATAAYGEKGKNGVIVVTMKKK